ncbi:MAG: hypothetical protein P8N26_06470 [Cyclobacteriaceae bacterium]|nr:hypothetical protein [Cyclobacteriaceae bacterium]
MKHLFYLSILLCAYGCTVPQESVKSEKYFSIDSLVLAQIALLQSNQNALTKTVQIGENIETQSFSSDAIDWESELKIFSILELNKSKFIGSIITETDQKSTSYRPKKDAFMPIKFFRITKDKGQLTTIDGYYLDDDAEVIYTSQRNLKMNFKKGVLTSFEIAGTQKVLFTDTTQFMVKGSIN